MATFRYRDYESPSSGLLFLAAGAVAGAAAGVFLAQRFGGFSGLSARVRDRLGDRFGGAGGAGADEGVARFSDEEYDDMYDDEQGAPDEVLEERVLEAFRNDPVLNERAVDIGAIGAGIIELTGWVQTDEESTHAVTLTRGVPGVETVVNRLAVRADDTELDRAAEEWANGEAETSAQWEGQGVGTGRRRQGTSDEPDRHADPKPELEDRWLSKEEAIRAAADDTEGLAERRKSAKKMPKGDRTGGAPIAPTGVPKADHVADPESARDLMREETGRDTLRAD